MADDNNPELLNLTFDGDDSPLTAAIERIIEELNRLQQVAQQSLSQSNEGFDLANKLYEIEDALKAPNAQIPELQRNVEGLASSYSHLSDELQQVASEYEDLKGVGINPAINPESYLAVDPYGAHLRGYGTTGGMIGPAEAPEDESASGFGSTFSISRGLMAGGALARQSGSPELGGLLMGGGELLRVSEGVNRLTQGLGELEGGINVVGIAASAAEVAFSPLVLVLGAVAATVAIVAETHRQYNEELKQGEEFLKRQLEVNEQYNTAVHTMTSAQVQQAVEDERNKLRIANDNAGDARNAIDRLMTQQYDAEYLKTLKDNGLGNRADEEVRNRPEFKALFEELDKANGAVEKSQSIIGRYTQGLEQNAFAVNDNIQYLKQDTDLRIRLAAEQVQFSNMSSKAAKDKIDSLNDEIEINKQTIKAIQDSGDTSQEAKDKIEKLWEVINGDQASVEQLTGSILPLIAIREKEAELVEYQKKQREEIAQIQDDYNKKTAQIKQREADQEVEIHRRAADKIIDITEKEIEARQRAIEKAQEKIQELMDDYNKNEADISRKAAYDDAVARQKELIDERDALTEHLRNLQEIRNRFNGDEYQALLDRDYIQLTKLKAQQQDAESSENSHYDQALASMRQQFADEQALLAQQRAFERQERLISYQQRIQEALAEEQRELEVARLAKERALELNRQEEEQQIRMAQQKRDAALRIAQDEYAHMLQIAGMSRDARLTAEFQTQTMLIQQAQQFAQQYGIALNMSTTPIYSSPIATAGHPAPEQFGEGGNFSGNSPFIMSEDGEAENLMIGSKGYNIGGAALVYPLQSGSVVSPSKTNGGNTFQISVYEANNARETADMVRQEIVSLLEKLE